MSFSGRSIVKAQVSSKESYVSSYNELTLSEAYERVFFANTFDNLSNNVNFGNASSTLRKHRSADCLQDNQSLQEDFETCLESLSDGECSPKKRQRISSIVRRGCWSVEEDALLCKLVLSSKNKVKWSDLSQRVPGRTAKQCRERWSCNLDPAINREPWSPQEDRDILRHQLHYGNRWASIAKNLPGRTENAVKTRYKSILRARKREWTESEDELLLTLHKAYGSSWAIIAESFPNRTKNAVKTRHRLLLRGEAFQRPELGSPNQIIYEDRINRSKQVQETSENFCAFDNTQAFNFTLDDSLAPLIEDFEVKEEQNLCAEYEIVAPGSDFFDNFLKDEYIGFQ